MSEDGRVMPFLLSQTLKTTQLRHYYPSASAVVIHYEEALHQVYAPLPLPYCHTMLICLLAVLLIAHSTV